jgi:hypothetical protein
MAAEKLAALFAASTSLTTNLAGGWSRRTVIGKSNEFLPGPVGCSAGAETHA